MKKYVIPMLEIVGFNSEEIISTSGSPEGKIFKSALFTEGEDSDETH